eukprot:s147_g31.t1
MLAGPGENMFSKQSAERFEKDRLMEDPTPGPGAYHLPSTMDGKGAILEVSERWSEGTEEEKLESNLSPLSPPFTRTPTPARGRDEKENRVPLSARCGSPRTWATPATQPTPKKAATPGPGSTPGMLGPASVALGCEDRRQRDLRLASKLDMVRDELRQKSKEAKELQLALTAKDRKIDDLSKKIEELAADRREAHRRSMEAENEVGAKRRQLHEKEQEVVALQRKLEHARLARKEWSKHAEKREEEQRNVQNEMLRMQQSVENLQEKLATSERDQHMAEQTLRQQQRHSSDLEAGFQAHIEVLEEQIARETCRRKELEERQAREGAERERGESVLKRSESRCEELQGQVVKLEIELKNKISSETSSAELRAKLEEELQRLRVDSEATSSSLQSSEASREDLRREVAKCSQQLQASNEELSSLKTQRAALEDEARLAAPSTNESVAKHDSVLPVASCSQRLFELLGNPAYDGYDECVNGKLNSSKSVWVGATAGPDALWLNYRRVILSERFCGTKNCSDGAALQCRKSCPMYCFDGGPNLLGCACRNECMKLVGCMARSGVAHWDRELAVEVRQSGVAHSDLELAVELRQCLLGSGARRCCLAVPTGMRSWQMEPGSAYCDLQLATRKHEENEEEEEEEKEEVGVKTLNVTTGQGILLKRWMKTFDDCASANVTYGNMWRSLSQTYRCLCSGHLQQDLRSQNCCESSSDSSSRSFCEANCSVDCSTPEALQCSEQCSSMCEGTKASQECNEQCLQSTGHCNQYKVCPVATPKFSYVCDDGEAPGLNGCCQGVFDNDRCPFLCEAQWKKSDIWSGTSRCECGACPSSVEESRKLMNETLLAAYDAWKNEHMD